MISVGGKKKRGCTYTGCTLFLCPETLTNAPHSTIYTRPDQPSTPHILNAYRAIFQKIFAINTRNTLKINDLTNDFWLKNVFLKLKPL